VEFRCRLASANGEIVEGVYIADTEARLRHELEEKGLFVLSLQPKNAVAGVSFSLYTAASSDVSVPTSSAAGTGALDLPRISCRTPGAILQPQPPPCEKEVSRKARGSGAFMGVAGFASRTSF